MTATNDQVPVTAGSGTNIGAHLLGTKKFQAIVQVDASGALVGTKETYVLSTGMTANVAAARTTHADLFNAVGSGKIVRVLGIFIIPSQTAVTGIGLLWELIRTTAVGTGGTAITPATFDTANAAVSASITARTKPTGGATTGSVFAYLNTTSEETMPYASMASVLNHVPQMQGAAQTGIVLREGEGLKLDQTTNSSVGTTNTVFVITIE